jgi:hypothetical protein
MTILLADGSTKQVADSYVPQEGEIIVLDEVIVTPEKENKFLKGFFKYAPIALALSSLTVLIIKRKTIF